MHRLRAAASGCRVSLREGRSLRRPERPGSRGVADAQAGVSVLVQSPPTAVGGLSKGWRRLMATKKDGKKDKEKDPGEAILKLVETLHEERKIPRETILGGIASAIQVAAERHFGVEEGVFVSVDPATGHI